MKLAKFVVFKGEDGQWYWKLQAGNGECVAISEGYTRKYSAKKGAATCRALARFAMIRDAGDE
jgi:uncharacterized protein YegP (UPF0339 family)